MRAAIKVLRGIIALLLIAVIGLNLWLLVQQSVFQKDPPEIFGYSQLVVTSGSMEPAFSAGDMILIRQEDAYRLGDIVTFRDGDGNLVTHRIVGSTEGSFITKGDANNTEDDALISPGQIVGRLVTCIPAVGGFMLFLRTPVGLFALVLAGFLLIELPSLLGARRQGKGRHAK